MHVVPAATRTGANPPPGSGMGSGARSRCAVLLWEPDLEGFPGRLEAESNENLVRVSAYFRVSPLWLKSKWGKIIWKRIKNNMHDTFSPFFQMSPVTSLISKPPFVPFSHRDTSLLALLSPFHRLTEPRTPSSLFTLSIWLNLPFPHVAQIISKLPFLTFSCYHSAVIFKAPSKPKVFAVILTNPFFPFLWVSPTHTHC